MKRILTKDEVLSSLGIWSFENVTQDKIMDFIKQARRMAPADQDDALRQIHGFVKSVRRALKNYMEMGKEAIKGNDENMKRLNDQYEAMQRFLEGWEKDELNFEEKKCIYEEMKKLVERAERKDNENKNFYLKVLGGMGALAVAIGGIVLWKSGENRS